MGLTERHWFENEDVPENYEWDLEDAVYNSRINKKVDMVEVVRCKNCAHNGKVEKCLLAAIAAEKGLPLFMLDNRGEWYCGDGKRRVTGMTNQDAVKWLENLKQDIGQLRHEDLWHYEQAIVEIIKLLENLEDLEKKYNSLLEEKISELIEENAKLNLEMNQAISDDLTQKGR